MRSFWTFTVVFSLLAVSWVPVQGQPIPDQYIVVLNDDVDPDQTIRGLGVAPLQVYRHALKGFVLQIPAQAAAALARNPKVKDVVQDQEVNLCLSGKDVTVIQGKAPKPTPSPTSTPGPEPTPVPVPPQIVPQIVPWGIARVGVCVTTTVEMKSQIGIAVIDTGVDLDHPDLNIAPADERFHVSRLQNEDDLHGHGTLVTGVIGAKNNEFGVVGVAPGAKIYPVKIYNKFNITYTSDILAAIDLVTAHADKIRVANVSFHYLPGTYLIEDAINKSIDAGIIYVVSAGNKISDATAYTPANIPNAITVSAIDDQDKLATDSNFGSVIDMTAPGVNILSTYLNGEYAFMSGTSMSAPHVTGAVALYLNYNFPNIRDYNDDGVVNRLDVITIRDAVCAAGIKLTTGLVDGDGPGQDDFNEPLVQVQTFYPTPTPVPTP